ncbi:hypothetical protein DFH29DRAFT_1056092 [Suillus ampliporus]|nr:hypothetical protein DFH29DRAFT_1056092 [Suillus ampliporus]
MTTFPGPWKGIGLNVTPIVMHLYPEITLATPMTNEINLSFDVTNPLDAELGISFLVKLVKGALASLPIIQLGYLDIHCVAMTRVGSGGYQIPWLHINQDPASYTLGVSLADLSSAAQSTTATTSHGSLTTSVPSLPVLTTGHGSSTSSSGVQTSAEPGPSGPNLSTLPLPTLSGNSTTGPL